MRDRSARQADARRRLETEPNVWIATASADGRPHLVPLSLAWDGKRILLATPTDTPTARNVAATGILRASLDDADDVVLIDAEVEVIDFGRAESGDVEHYVERVGWNPADEPGPWSLIIATPRTIRAWNGVHETTGRTIMRDGVWSGGSG